MSFVAYEIEELEKKGGYSCLYCLVVASKFRNLVTGEGVRQSLHIYTTERSREYGLRHWRSEYNLTETVFFTFEIPIDFYLEKAIKQI